MVSLGNISREENAPQLDKYQVFKVHQKGFRTQRYSRGR